MPVTDKSIPENTTQLRVVSNKGDGPSKSLTNLGLPKQQTEAASVIPPTTASADSNTIQSTTSSESSGTTTARPTAKILQFKPVSEVPKTTSIASAFEGFQTLPLATQRKLWRKLLAHGITTTMSISEIEKKLKLSRRPKLRLV